MTQAVMDATLVTRILEDGGTIVGKATCEVGGLFLPAYEARS
jgi:Asp-tRNA(Asn)/Glu-tRNA(Gln) amidotransferase A subunit family amidase